MAKKQTIKFDTEADFNSAIGNEMDVIGSGVIPATDKEEE